MVFRARFYRVIHSLSVVGGHINKNLIPNSNEIPKNASSAQNIKTNKSSPIQPQTTENK